MWLYKVHREKEKFLVVNFYIWPNTYLLCHNITVFLLPESTLIFVRDVLQTRAFGPFHQKITFLYIFKPIRLER